MSRKNTFEDVWKRINIKDKDNCWEWKGYLNSNGYGQIKINLKRYTVTRIVYELTYSKIPKGLYISHKCNNKKCCNPQHLFLYALHNKPCSQKTKDKISKTLTGKYCGKKSAIFGIPKSQDQKDKISKSLMGNIPWNKNKIGVMPCKENHPMYGKFGKEHPVYKNPEDRITTLGIQIRTCEKYIEWRTNVYKRDLYICQECNKNNKNLNAHHIKELSLIIKENNIITFEQALNCPEIWDLNNGKTLCRKCHEKTFKYNKKEK